MARKLGGLDHVYKCRMTFLTWLIIETISSSGKLFKLDTGCKGISSSGK